jgi:heme exporter protein D
VYTGTTLTWLSFGEGLGFVGLALIGLVAHELKTERSCMRSSRFLRRRTTKLQAAA